jgi:DNA processing protein
MCSNMLAAVLASRSLGGSRPRSARSVDRLWAAMSPFERVQLEREVESLTTRGVRATLMGGVEPLFYLGPLESAGSRVLAVLGPREARPESVRLARHAATVAVASGTAVLSGDAGGLEAEALRSALDSGGLAISVLAEGFSSTVRRPERGLVRVTPCAPGMSWTVESAMARNATIAGLCTALVAVDAAGTGATLDAGMRALAAGRPVLAVGATAGSRLLVDYGAMAATDEVELAWWLQTRTGTDLGTGFGTGRPAAVDVVAPAVTGVAVATRFRGCEVPVRPTSRPENRATWPRPTRRLAHSAV